MKVLLVLIFLIIIGLAVCVNGFFISEFPFKTAPWYLTTGVISLMLFVNFLFTIGVLKAIDDWDDY